MKTMLFPMNGESLKHMAYYADSLKIMNIAFQ